MFLARAGFYDGIEITRVERTEDHALLQIGDPPGEATTAGYTFEAEAPSPVARYTRGSVAMVFAGEDRTTASSQFMIIADDFEELSYPARRPINTLLGAVVDPESLRTLDVITQGAIVDGRPAEPVTIHSARVTETRRFGEDGDETIPCDQTRTPTLDPGPQTSAPDPPTPDQQQAE